VTEGVTPHVSSLGRFRKIVKGILLVALVLLAIGASMKAIERFAGMVPEARFALYEIRMLVRPNMTEERLRGVLRAAEQKGLECKWKGAHLSIWTDVGILHPYYLLVEIRDNQVLHATTRDGETGMHPSDAPADS
jgi:hypothetical protein